MYTPGHFNEDDLPTLHATLRRHPFALLVTPHQGDLHLTHLPFRLDAERGPRGTLEAHLARQNPHCAAILAGAPSVAVFAGPHGYVSPRWYLDPAKNVPTWSYVAIHAHGTPRPVSEPTALLALIGRLTDEHEAYIERPWSVAEAAGHAARLSANVLGFTIELSRLEGKYKLSQNRPPADRARVMEQLRQRGGQEELVALMEGLYLPDGTTRQR